MQFYTYFQTKTIQKMTISLLKKSNHELLDIKKIRKLVFSDELKIPESNLFDEYDHTCERFLIKNDQTIIGALRLRKENDSQGNLRSQGRMQTFKENVPVGFKTCFDTEIQWWRC